MRFGWRWNTGEKIRSATAYIELHDISEMNTAIGASGAVLGTLPDVPKCRHSGSSASSAAEKSGSQWSVWNDGRPSVTMFSGKEIARAPLAATRWISATDASTSQNGRMASGMNRLRGGGAPLVEEEVVPGLGAEPGQFHVLALEEQRAGELGELREAQRRLHPVEVHVLHPLDRVVAAGDHVLVADGVEPQGLRRLAGHGVEAHLGVDVSFVQPGLRMGLHVGAELAVHALVTALDHPGAGVLVLLGHPVEPDAAVLDEVVVDRDQVHVVLERHR